ncbi:MAG: hypothetical protein ACJ74U_10945 [Jatrophihabitantaceae bacterium]
MSEPDTSSTGRNGVKTLGIRFKPALHTQLSVIAQLRGRSFQDEVIAASEAHVAQAKTDPALVSRIEAAMVDIDRDAASRRDALAALFGTAEPTAQAAGTGAEQPVQPDSGGKPSGPRRSGGGRTTS